MDLILFILYYAVVGAIVGGLGRLAIPGPNPMSIGMTILVGIGGAVIGGIIAYALGAPGLGFILAIVVAAGIVYLMQRRGGGVRRGVY
jgi:uncharacterized membrane protein YeaQ/YmgE (transglycosylase-associated protein family)